MQASSKRFHSAWLAGPVWSVCFQVDDVDALYGELSAAGVLHYADRGSPTDTDYGTREGAHIDPDGNLLRYGSWR